MFLFALAPLSVLLASKLGSDQHLVCRRDDCHGLRRPPSLVGQHLHDRVRHVPEEDRRFCDGDRRHGRCARWHFGRAGGGGAVQALRILHKIEVGYGIMFIICGLAYVTAWLIMHLLVPKFKKIVV
jgi:ACS family hexuronate transporter-like MFS transporter